LHRFPFDTIKIPPDFVQISAVNGAGHTQGPIMRAIIALANDLDLAVIAEGVETQPELERLREHNCRLAQGFAFGAAMSASEFTKHLTAQLAR
jgi:EAL domain-containing protein (putative c-di-GMP-specific phosphodiesterase class I)